MGKIIYQRGTSYGIAVNYTNANGVHGVTAMFTVKENEFDADTADATAILKKDVGLASGTPDMGNIAINPADIADSVTPGKKFYDVKVLDANGAIYKIDEGTFELKASPTNRLS
jgi:hypothetical protein